MKVKEKITELINTWNNAGDYPINSKTKTTWKDAILVQYQQELHIFEKVITDIENIQKS